MAGWIRRRTTCRVPGHGTRCEPSRERDNDHYRTTEERLALRYEAAANEGEERLPRWYRAARGADSE